MSEDKPTELINIQLTKEDYQVFKSIMEREKAYNYFKKRASSLWIWVVAGGILTIWQLWDKIFKAV